MSNASESRSEFYRVETPGCFESNFVAAKITILKLPNFKIHIFFLVNAALSCTTACSASKSADASVSAIFNRICTGRPQVSSL